MNQIMSRSLLALAFVWCSADAFVGPPSPARSSRLAAQARHEFALLFDCDGVILETEELHRVAYNAAFQEFDLTIGGAPVEWSVSAV